MFEVQVKGKYSHTLSVAEVGRRTAKAIKELLNGFAATKVKVIRDNETDEMEFSCIISTYSISGEVSINEDHIKVVVDLPPAGIVFKKQVKDAMDKRIPKYLEEKELVDEP